ncbi:hypothetical protein BEI64_02155 [Eisenbergiella tayi]|nr:hypothetical protein BEI64_02155 [Eisenbergiella tayi]
MRNGKMKNGSMSFTLSVSLKAGQAAFLWNKLSPENGSVIFTRISHGAHGDFAVRQYSFIRSL